MPTIRTTFDRQYRIVKGIIYGGLLTFGISALVLNIIGLPEGIWIVALVFFAIAWVASMTGYYLLFRCPACRGNLGTTVMAQIPAKSAVRYCPYCGSDFDSSSIKPSPQPRTEER